MNKLQIYLSPIAENQFEKICDYLITEWSEKSKKDFIFKLDKKFSQISAQPRSCPESESFKGLRKAVVDNKTSFLYRIKSTSIEILTIYDNRQSLKTIKKKAKGL